MTRQAIFRIPSFSTYRAVPDKIRADGSPLATAICAPCAHSSCWCLSIPFFSRRAYAWCFGALCAEAYSAHCGLHLPSQSEVQVLVWRRHGPRLRHMQAPRQRVIALGLSIREDLGQRAAIRGSFVTHWLLLMLTWFSFACFGRGEQKTNTRCDGLSGMSRTMSWSRTDPEARKPFATQSSANMTGAHSVH